MSAIPTWTFPKLKKPFEQASTDIWNYILVIGLQEAALPQRDRATHSRTAHCDYNLVRYTSTLTYLLFYWFTGWLRGTAVERRSLAGELSLSCAWPVADGWPFMWVIQTVRYRSINQANSAFHPLGVNRWVLSCNWLPSILELGLAPSGKRLRRKDGHGVFADKTVWCMPEIYVVYEMALAI